MKHRRHSAKPVCRFHRFWGDEDGSYTIESVIWFPIFAILLTFVTNISIVFFNESQILRVMQDGNRAYSLGRLTSAEEVQTYISNNLAYLQAGMTIVTETTGGFVTTNLSVPATDLMPLNLMTSAFDSITIAVNAQHIIEF
ncbi:Flp pilus assembly protein TadG [Sulfitobacter brevis]|uniref:Flp pilus assembly protein TadG n=1 Tax=Sulfitobacter brevis TaxID=74348 RepID=A0A1I2AMY5_9RHOB|nr:TadE/TadG family type IV pilus assembly protein [Sulfitobacter brevis]SFE44363.1 Flp pilus assembly protein TadG [Sulfitobacter brevis]